MTLAAGSKRRSAAAISPRRAIAPLSGSGICMAAMWRGARRGSRPRAGPDAKNRAKRARFPIHSISYGRPGPAAARSALAGLVARVGLVDDIDAALAPDDATVLVAALGRFQRVDDLH